MRATRQGGLPGDGRDAHLYVWSPMKTNQLHPAKNITEPSAPFKFRRPRWTPSAVTYTLGYSITSLDTRSHTAAIRAQYSIPRLLHRECALMLVSSHRTAPGAAPLTFKRIGIKQSASPCWSHRRPSPLPLRKSFARNPYFLLPPRSRPRLHPVLHRLPGGLCPCPCFPFSLALVSSPPVPGAGPRVSSLVRIDVVIYAAVHLRYGRCHSRRGWCSCRP